MGKETPKDFGEMNAAQRAAHFKKLEDKKTSGRKTDLDREMEARNELYRTAGGQVPDGGKVLGAEEP